MCLFGTLEDPKANVLGVFYIVTIYIKKSICL